MSSLRNKCDQYIMDKQFNGIVITVQCASYNWIDKNKDNFFGLYN